MRYFGIFVAGGAFNLSVLAWIMLSGLAAPLGMAAIAVNASPPVPLSIIGFVAGIAATALVFLVRQAVARTANADGPDRLLPQGQVAAAPKPQSSARQPSDRVALILGVAFAGIAALLFVAVAQKQIEALPAALVLICGTLTLLAASYALEGLARGDEIEVNSHWGGLGGSLGGWRVSPITTLLLLALIFLGATITAGAGEGDETSNSAANSTANSTGSSTSNTANASGAGTVRTDAGNPGSNNAAANAIANDAAAPTGGAG